VKIKLMHLKQSSQKLVLSPSSQDLKDFKHDTNRSQRGVSANSSSPMYKAKQEIYSATVRLGETVLRDHGSR